MTRIDERGDLAPAGDADAPPAGRRQGVLDTVARHQGVLMPVIAVLLAFGVGAALIRLQGVNPAYAYETIFTQALLTPDGLLRTLQKTTPLVLSGLAVVVALKVGLFNIGAQGQLLWGAIGAAFVGATFSSLPAVVLIPFAVAAGAACGALWAGIAGALKAYRGVHEVISTIMLNSVAAGVIDYLVSEPLKEPGQPIPRSSTVAQQAWLPDLGPVPAGLVIALVLAAATWWVLRRTTTGYAVDVVGTNRWAAAYAGVRIPRVVVGSMLVSGALAGLGGAVETLGVVHRYESGSSAGLGFDGITIALLARANPLATIPAALLVGVLRSGAAGLQFDTGIQPEIVDVLLAVTLLLVSVPVLANMLLGRRRARSGLAVAGGWGN